MFYSQDSLRRKYGKVEFEMSLPHTMEFSVWFILYLHFLSNYFFDHDLITDIRKFEVSSTEVELFISWSNLQLVGDQFWMKPQNLGEMMPNKWLSDAQTFFWKEKTSVQDVATKNKSRLVLNNLDCALKWGRIFFFKCFAWFVMTPNKEREVIAPEYRWGPRCEDYIWARVDQLLVLGMGIIPPLIVGILIIGI